MNKHIHILVVEPEKAPYALRIENSGEAAERVIGGKFDAYCLMPHKVLLLHRQDGEQAGLPSNRKNPYLPGYIHGTFLLCGLGDNGTLASLTFPQIHEFQSMFTLPDGPPPMPDEYMTVENKICATPNELLLAVYHLWDDLAVGESATLTKHGDGRAV